MTKIALTFAFFLFAWAAQAFSLQDPTVTTAYYTITDGHSGQLNSLNNNDVAIGEEISCCLKRGASFSYGDTYNIQTGDGQSAVFDNSVAFRFSSLNDNGVYVGYGQLNDYNGGFIGSLSSFRGYDHTFTPFTVPGAYATFPYSINDSGVVVGSYTNSAHGSEHGFIYSPDGTFQTLDDPALKGTRLVGINNSGQIVGDASDGSLNGFLYSASAFTQLTYGVPAAINDAGVIAIFLGVPTSRFGGQEESGGLLYPDGTLALTFFISPYRRDILPFTPGAINDQGAVIFDSASAFIATPIAPEPAPLGLLLCAAAASGLVGILRRRH